MGCRESFRSCRGPGAAAWLQTLPTAPGICLPDRHFQLACRMRPGQATYPEGKTCQRRSQGGARCDAPLGKEDDHAHTCERGRQRQVRRDGQRRATARILRRHRIGCEEEVRVPEWGRTRRNGTVQRARLDLRIEGGPGALVRIADHKLTLSRA